jgi:hypothetical protein
VRPTADASGIGMGLYNPATAYISAMTTAKIAAPTSTSGISGTAVPWIRP